MFLIFKINDPSRSSITAFLGMTGITRKSAYIMRVHACFINYIAIGIYDLGRKVAYPRSISIVAYISIAVTGTEFNEFARL